jgi:hypothetical protein
MQKELEQIQRLQKEMGYQQFIDKHIDNRLMYARDTALALVIELVETMQETPWKPWVDPDKQPFNPPKIARELCDVMVFTLNLFNTLCPDESIEEAWAETLDKIEQRINVKRRK